MARGIGLDNGSAPSSCMQAWLWRFVFSRDTLALSKIAHDFGTPIRLVETIGSTTSAACYGPEDHRCCGARQNHRHPRADLQALDDMREAPSLAIIQALVDAGAKIKAYDPEGMKAAAEMVSGIDFARSAYDAATGADALVIVTEWSAFRSLDFAHLKTVMAAPILVDLRNIYRRAEIESHGFVYASVGRGTPRIIETELAEAAE